MAKVKFLGSLRKLLTTLVVLCLFISNAYADVHFYNTPHPEITGTYSEQHVKLLTNETSLSHQLKSDKNVTITKYYPWNSVDKFKRGNSCFINQISTYHNDEKKLVTQEILRTDYNGNVCGRELHKGTKINRNYIVYDTILIEITYEYHSPVEERRFEDIYYYTRSIKHKHSDILSPFALYSLEFNQPLNQNDIYSNTLFSGIHVNSLNFNVNNSLYFIISKEFTFNTNSITTANLYHFNKQRDYIIQNSTISFDKDTNIQFLRSDLRQNIWTTAKIKITAEVAMPA